MIKLVDSLYNEIDHLKQFRDDALYNLPNKTLHKRLLDLEKSSNLTNKELEEINEQQLKKMDSAKLFSVDEKTHYDRGSTFYPITKKRTRRNRRRA